jgi:hypothetical protein
LEPLPDTLEIHVGSMIRAAIRQPVRMGRSLDADKRIPAVVKTALPHDLFDDPKPSRP